MRFEYETKDARFVLKVEVEVETQRIGRRIKLIDMEEPQVMKAHYIQPYTGGLTPVGTDHLEDLLDEYRGEIDEELDEQLAQYMDGLNMDLGEHLAHDY